MFSERTIRDYLASQDYYLGTSRKRINGTDSRPRCAAIDLEMRVPNILKEIFNEVSVEETIYEDAIEKDHGVGG